MSIGLAIKVDLGAVATFASELTSVATALDEWVTAVNQERSKALANWRGKTADLFDVQITNTRNWTVSVTEMTRTLASGVTTFHDTVRAIQGHLAAIGDRGAKGGLLVSSSSIVLPPGPTFIGPVGAELPESAKAALAAHATKVALYRQLEGEVAEEFRSLEEAHRAFQGVCRGVRAPALLGVEGRPSGGGGWWSDIINAVQGLFTGNQGEADYGGTIIVDVSSVAVDGPAAQAMIADIGQVHQGAIGDCWLIAALAAVGQRDPAFIDRHINRVGDGWEVTLYQDGKPVVVRVEANELVRNGARDANGCPSWMSVYEEAVAKHYGNNYAALVADAPSAGLDLITGQRTTQSVLPPSPQELADAIADGRPVTAMTDPIDPWRDDLAAAHVYVVESVDPVTGNVTLVNPWGTGNHGVIADRVTISYADYRANFIMTGIGGKP